MTQGAEEQKREVMIWYQRRTRCSLSMKGICTQDHPKVLYPMYSNNNNESGNIHYYHYSVTKGIIHKLWRPRRDLEIREKPFRGCQRRSSIDRT